MRELFTQRRHPFLAWRRFYTKAVYLYEIIFKKWSHLKYSVSA